MLFNIIIFFLIFVLFFLHYTHIGRPPNLIKSEQVSSEVLDNIASALDNHSKSILDMLTCIEFLQKNMKKSEEESGRYITSLVTSLTELIKDYKVFRDDVSKFITEVDSQLLRKANTGTKTVNKPGKPD